MNRLQLLRRNLLHFRGVNLAVIIGMAVATAVLSGAMMVGDSVRGSLRALALQRLGNIDYAIISTRFFDDSLVNRIQNSTTDFELAPAAIVQGAASAESSGTRTADVQIAAGAWVDVDRNKCVINGELADSLGISSPGESVVLSLPSDTDAPRDGALDRRSRGDTISTLRVQVSRIVRDPGVISLFNPNGGQRATRNAWVNLPDLQDAIDKPGGINALLAHVHSGSADAAGLKTLNDALTSVVALDDYGLTRTNLVSETEVAIGSRDTYLAPPVVEAADAVAASLAVPLQKISVNLLTSVIAKRIGGGSRTNSPETPGAGTGEVPPIGAGSHPASHPAESVPVLSASPDAKQPDTTQADSAQPDSTQPDATQSGPTQPDTTQPDSTQPGTTLPSTSQPTTEPAATAEPVIPRDVMHYAVVAGVSQLDGQPLGPKEIAVNEWTAEHLGVKEGDSLIIDFYERGPNGELRNASASHSSSDLTFTVSRVLPMDGIGADPTLPPDYKGLTDADSVADWHPPEGLTIDKSLVTKDDEAYWKDYRAAPKMFVSFDTARKLWGGVYGDVTGLRVPAEKAEIFCEALRTKISPASMQIAFRAIKSEQFAAASGGTDFGEYFLYFSFFLIVAAVLLVAMLFRLGIELRARQLGLMSAIGFAPGEIRKLALGEGLILALIGGALGSIAAIGYTWLIMAGLRTWWVGAVGTTALRLHVRPVTLVAGFVAGTIVAMLAVWWGAWRIGRIPVARLLAGSWENEIAGRRRSGRALRIIGIVCLLCGIAAVASAAAKRAAADEAFLAGGTLLLVGSLAWLSGALRTPWHGRPAHANGAAQRQLLDLPNPKPLVRSTVKSLLTLGIRNATRHTARSVLAVGLIAFAVFTLIVVAVMRQGTAQPGNDRKSGTGGYSLILNASIPIYGDLNTVEGRKLAGIKDPSDPLWSKASFMPMRRWAGQDISCLNLMRPTAPTILSVPDAPDSMLRHDQFTFDSMLQRNRFTFTGTIAPADNPWTLLRSDQGDAIPVIADNDTAQYILKIPIGGELPITDQLGRTRRLRLVATIAHSIFQSELLMGDTNFRKLFPATGGAGVILVDCDPKNATVLRQRLASELDEYSVSVDTTAQRLAAYEAVANTYLATFQTLGSLGLLLGTIGLAVVLVRTVLERKPELALLSCLGFAPGSRVKLVLGENVFLLVLGLTVGTVSAVVGVLPAMIASGRSMNLTGLALTLLAVLVVGLLASSSAVALSGIHVSPADLRRE